MSRISALSFRALVPTVVLAVGLAACDGSPTEPAAKTLLAVTAAGGKEVGVVNLDGSGYVRLAGPELCAATTEPCADPSWSPDGKSVLFTTETRDPFGLHVFVADVSGGVRRLVPAGGVLQEEFAARVSPDGQWVYLTARTASEGFGVWRVGRDGSNPVRVGPPPPQYANDRVFGVSPDGRHVLIESGRSGIQALVKLDVATAALTPFSASGPVVAQSPADERVALFQWDYQKLLIENGAGVVTREIRSPDGVLARFGNGLAWAPDGSYLLARGEAHWYWIDPSSGRATPVTGLDGYVEAAVRP
ncbi:MAG TPA: hypothetical protein VJT67_07485 [Longimicrobiaceae bacterium]|nr:hypothetical protein [Longimicrobiaceae bacterium]